MTYDPTDEPRGYTRMPASTRGLLVKSDTTTNPFFRGCTGKTTKALGPCTVTRADGSTVDFKTGRVIYGKRVSVKNRTLRAPITDYIEVAERVGLDPAHVAELYRYERDNGHTPPTEVSVEFNATFRGGDF